MRLLIFCSLLFVLLGCSKEDFDFHPGSFTSISSISYNKGTGSGYEGLMTYDSEGKLARVDSVSSYQYMEIEYDNDLPSVLLIYRNSDDTLEQRQELSYNNEDQLISMTIQYSGGIVNKNQLITFEYDKRGRRIREDNIHDDYHQYSLYTWNANNNISRAQTFTANDELLYEYRYKYDKKKNPLLHFPTQLRNPNYLSANNITESKFKGGNSIIDVACEICPIEYEYNEEDLPVKVIYSWGSTWEIGYE